ncbi:MAG TPA: GLUG motif-containing protein, partial [Candidatus Hydrogenedentes bacterium]|nr:GLUG motif-containing protein [Candidatus Hydrogenedentota bacterium]
RQLTATPEEGNTFIGWCGDGFMSSIPILSNNLPIVMFGNINIRAYFLTNTPISISSIEDLQNIGHSPVYPLSWNYLINNDIDASATASWNSGKGFSPIGNSVFPFTGSLDGQNHIISNLTIHRPEDTYIGLFGYVGSEGHVQNTGLAGCSISGYHDVGGLAGLNEHVLTGCYATGTIQGSQYVGGLVGDNLGTLTQCYAAGSVSDGDIIGGLVGGNFEGSVEQCYSLCMVLGGENVGGLIGFNVGSNTVIQCYAMGRVSGTSSVGGLIGASAYSTVFDSFWDMETSEQTSSQGGTGITTEQLLQSDTFIGAGWDFTHVWAQTDGQTAPYLSFSTLPETNYTLHIIIVGNGSVSPPAGSYLAWSIINPTALPEAGYAFVGWFGDRFFADESTPMDNVTIVMYGNRELIALFIPDPIPIHTIDELQKIGNDIAYPISWNYILENDIDASETASWNGGEGFIPVGNSAFPFTGTLNGQDHIISNLAGSNGGLFGYVAASGIIEHLNLRTCQISGNFCVGALADRNCGQISQCSTSGSVAELETDDMDEDVGGVVGWNRGSLIQCRSECSVSGNGNAGGLVGENSLGTVTQCSATGKVSSMEWGEYSYPGGLIGSNDGTVTQCFATGPVSQYGYEGCGGGLIAINGGTVSQCYAAGTFMGESGGGGLVGWNDGPVTCCYALGIVSRGIGVGGLIGFNSNTVTQCYSIGPVSGNSLSLSSEGGLIGENDGGTVKASFWDVETSGQATSAGGTGITTQQLLQSATFTNAAWDYALMWAQTDGQTVPYLLSLTTPPTTYSLTVGIHGNGSVTPPDTSYPAWSLIMLTAIPETGYTPAGWNGDGFFPFTNLRSETLPVVIYGNIALTAYFLPDAPIMISDLDSLQRIGHDPAFPLWWQYLLQTNIDASSTENWNEGKGFDPIGDTLFLFNGTFNGQNHDITSLTINRPQENSGGLFGLVGPEGKIQKLGITNGQIFGGYLAGAFASENFGVIEQCHASITQVVGDYVGGLVGWNLGLIQQSSVTGSVSGWGHVGGLVGLNDSDSFYALKQPYGPDALSGRGAIGDQTRIQMRSIIDQCYTIVTVTNNDNFSGNTGGLVGLNSYGIVTDSFALGPVSGDFGCGGLIGGSSSYGTVARCYSTGLVLGDEDYNGGLIGLCDYKNDEPVIGSYWDIETSGMDYFYSYGGIGKTTAEMMQKDTFANWDFCTIWAIREGQTYPFLRTTPEYTEGELEGYEEEGSFCEGLVEGEAEGEGMLEGEEGEGVPSE